MKENAVTRAEVEDFLYHEAALLDDWRLDDWLELLTDDAAYYVPSTDAPASDHRKALFLIADDFNRICARVKRLKDTEAHAEFPHSRTRRMIGNVRITDTSDKDIMVEANFTIYRFRRGAPERKFVGRYVYRLALSDGGLKIAERHAILDCTELGAQGAVSFIL
ncbi:aromatic-ring-hydroxylating dioxygenase subunit beta [Alphaproteobacteria bacterium]|nr:aromatic-ring-hydroxylating dioxygenase subunit beta [Alphaproteobacteria bacterium]